MGRSMAGQISCPAIPIGRPGPPRQHTLYGWGDVDFDQDCAAKSFHSLGTPFNAWLPMSMNSMPEPATRSFTVPETRTLAGFAFDMIRAPMFTAIPPTLW